MAAADPPVTPRVLLDRWDAQQAVYIADREARFDIMLRTLELIGIDDPVVLDLACGPGSLTERVHRALPTARVVALDKDPVLLEIARRTVGTSDRVTVVDADLDDPAWVRSVAGWRFDAVLSSTALHWLHPGTLARVYLELATMLPEGGVVMNADHLRFDEHDEATLARVARQEGEHVEREALRGGAQDWDAWWAAAEALDGFGALADQRRARFAGSAEPPPHATRGSTWPRCALRASGRCPPSGSASTTTSCSVGARRRRPGHCAAAYARRRGATSVPSRLTVSSVRW